MTNITLNHKNGTIELTKSFSNASSKYGSEAYNQLQQVRRDYPTYQIVTASSKAGSGKRDMLKGLNFEYMEVYIEKHDNEQATIMKAYKELRGTAEEYEGLGVESESYMTIRSWFLEQFPEVANFQSKRENMVANIQQKKEAAREAKKAAAIQARRAALIAKIA